MAKRNGLANYVVVHDPVRSWVILPRAQCMSLMAGKLVKAEWADRSVSVAFAEIAFIDGDRKLVSFHVYVWKFCAEGTLDRNAFAASLAQRLDGATDGFSRSADGAQLGPSDLAAISKILHVDIDTV